MPTPITPPLPKPTPAAEAKASGYWPLTTAYLLPGDRWMLDNTLKDLAAAGTSYCLVGEPQAPEVWRAGALLHNSSCHATQAATGRTRPWDS